VPQPVSQGRWWRARAAVGSRALRRRANALRATKKRLAGQLGAGELDDVEFAAAKRANDAKLAEVEAELLTVTVLPVTKRGRGFDFDAVKVEPA
jgi:hypothetical protein